MIMMINYYHNGSSNDECMAPITQNVTLTVF